VVKRFQEPSKLIGKRKDFPGGIRKRKKKAAELALATTGKDMEGADGKKLVVGEGNERGSMT